MYSGYDLFLWLTEKNNKQQLTAMTLIFEPER
jgi:hypothetical protein